MGKHKYIETPEIMWQLFEQYKKHTKSRVRILQKATPRGVVNEEHTPPLTMEGFECFVMDNTKITYPDLTEYFDGKNKSYVQYFHVCSRIKREIRNDQIEGGMIGQYNPSITQRLNGLAEKKESKQEHSGEVGIKVVLTNERVEDTQD